jgi:hypothetical protein
MLAAEITIFADAQFISPESSSPGASMRSGKHFRREQNPSYRSQRSMAARFSRRARRERFARVRSIPADWTSAPVAITSNDDTSNLDCFLYSGSAADLATVHFSAILGRLRLAAGARLSRG